MSVTSTRNVAGRAAAIAVVLVMLLVAWRIGWFARLGQPRSLAHALVEQGARGYLAFVLAYALLQPFGVPGTVFVVAAPLIWPWPIAFALSMVGTMAASVIGFSFARFVARDFVAARIPSRFRRYDEALERHAFRTVFLLRLVFWMPQALHFFLGVSKVRGTTHFWASLLGYALPVLAMSYFGARLFDADGRMRKEAWVAMAIAAIVVAAVLVAWRFVERRCLTPR